MKRRPPLSVVQREKIAELRGEHGWSYLRIAQQLDVTEGSVSWYCLMQGIEKPGKPRAPWSMKGPMVMKRGAGLCRRFTEEDDRQLLILEAEGKNYCQIASALGRKRNSIVGRLATLARREERRVAAEEAV